MYVEVRKTPVTLRREMVRTDFADPLKPGFIVGLSPILPNNPLLQQAIGAIVPKGVESSPVLLVEPEQTPWIFAHERELDIVKSVASLALQSIRYGKLTVDALWLVYGAAKLHHDWNRPNRDTGACVFKILNLGFGVAKLPGDFSPSFAIPDHWGNGINFVFKSGEALYQGKTPPINETMMLSMDKRMAVPIKLMKYFDLALDPDPLYRGITTTAVPGPHIPRQM
jgi:hypothetical protein